MAVSYVTRKNVQEQITQLLDGEETLFHIAGEPGVGKTFLLDWVEEEFGDEYKLERVELGSHHSIQTVAQKIYRTVLSDIPESVKEGNREITGVSASAGVGGGVSWTRNPPDWADNRFEYIEALDQMSNHIPEGHKRLICLDDVHNVDDDEEKIKDTLSELSELLGPEITLLSAGRLQFTGQIPVIRLSTFSEAQTVELLTNEVPEMEPATARELHNRLSGHPYYLGLLVDIDNPTAATGVPEEDIRDYIEEEYLSALSGDEERLLQATSPLIELDEHVCSAVLADDNRFDQVGVRRLLRRLNKQVIVQERRTGPDGTARYAIHDKFREFLLRQESDPIQIHLTAFEFYSNRLRNQIAADGTDFEQVTQTTTLCTHHLSTLIELQDQQQIVADFLKTTLGKGGLPFYTATIVLDELKAWPTDDVPDAVVAAILSALEEREPLARYFFDDETDRTWAEQLYDKGVFADPDVPHMQYLDSIVEVHPDFVVKVIRNLDSDNLNTQRWLISIAGELPGDAAAETAPIIESWASKSESFQQLDFHAIQLIQHLVENDEIDAGLTVLGGVLQAPERDADLDWQQDKQFAEYQLHELFEETRERFVEACGRVFLDALEDALRQTLKAGTDSEGNPIYDSVAPRTPIIELDYDENNTGERKHILFTYLSRAATQWVSADPPDNGRVDLITSYLDDPIPAFRRIGLFLLSQHPDTYQDIVAGELGEEAHYGDESIQYDFYKLVESAVSSIDDDQLDQVYQVLREGPQCRQWIRDRASHVAQEGEQSEDEIAQELVERWRLERLYPLDGEVSADQQDYIDFLVEKYGVPERTASEPYSPSVSGGIVNETGPENLETLRTWSAETVLQMCVDWEPPEGQSLSFGEDERKEISHWGFAQQLSQLVEEQPASYAEKIGILEDAKPQYADVVLDGLVEALRDNGRFSWQPVLSFCDTVIDEPGQWPSRTCTSIALLLREGIQADQTEFPSQDTEHIERLLVSLLTEADIATDEERPQSWKGGVGDPEEQVRRYAISAVVSYISWQDKNDLLADRGLVEPLRGAIQTRILEDDAVPVRNALGRYFQAFWAADRELIQTHLDDMFPRGDENESKQRFSAVWEGYTRGNPLIQSAFSNLRPYYRHALDLLAEDESDEGWISAEPTASHIGMAYVFEKEPLDDHESLVRLFYDMMEPKTTVYVAQAFSQALDIEDNPLHDHWDAISELWQWRLNQIEAEISDIEDAAEYHQEFRYFLRSLQRIEEISLEDEQELVERTSIFLVHRAVHVRIIEEWLAEQSATYPDTAISVYHAIIDAVPDQEWHNVARSSKDEKRKTLYTNAIQADDESGSTAYKVANRFASAGYEMDKEILDSYLSGDYDL